MGAAPSPAMASAQSFDDLAARLQAVREHIGVHSTALPAPSAHQPTTTRAAVPAIPTDRPAAAGTPATLRFPRVGWDLVLLAGAWAGMLAVVISLLV